MCQGRRAFSLWQPALLAVLWFVYDTSGPYTAPRSNGSLGSPLRGSHSLVQAPQSPIPLPAHLAAHPPPCAGSVALLPAPREPKAAGNQPTLWSRLPSWACEDEQARAAYRASGSTDPAPASASFGKSVRLGDEDLFAYSTYFFGVRNGLILESGALDGKQHSNSNLFVHALGWRALHVEASPFNWRALVRQRPESINIHAALCSRPQQLTFVYKEANDAVAGLWELMSPSSQRGFWGHLLNSPEKLAAFPKVSCVPVQSLLDMFRITHIDFWVLDIEGGELDAVQSVDFTRTRVDVIVVEAFYDPEQDERVRAALTRVGFVLHSLQEVATGGGNMWYTHHSFVPRGEPGVVQTPGSTPRPRVGKAGG